MKAILLAGGHGTRLFPITKTRAKPLLPLDGKPIIQYQLEELVEMDVDEIIITVNKKYEDDFDAFLRDAGYTDETTVMTEDHLSDDEKHGSIGAIIACYDMLVQDDDLLILGADNYFPFSIENFVEYAQSKAGIVNACCQMDDDVSSFGVVQRDEERALSDDKDRIIGFQEKPDVPKSQLVSTAAYFFPEKSLDIFTRYEDEGGDMDAAGQLIEWGFDKYPMFVYEFSGDWFDIGTREGYLEAQRTLADQSATIHGDASVENSLLENVIVFPGAEVRDSVLRDTIVDTGATIEDRTVSDAIVGKWSRLQ